MSHMNFQNVELNSLSQGFGMDLIHYMWHIYQKVELSKEMKMHLCLLDEVIFESQKREVARLL